MNMTRQAGHCFFHVKMISIWIVFYRRVPNIDPQFISALYYLSVQDQDIATFVPFGKIDNVKSPMAAYVKARDLVHEYKLDSALFVLQPFAGVDQCEPLQKYYLTLLGMKHDKKALTRIAELVKTHPKELTWRLAEIAVVGSSGIYRGAQRLMQNVQREFPDCQSIGTENELLDILVRGKSSPLFIQSCIKLPYKYYGFTPQLNSRLPSLYPEKEAEKAIIQNDTSILLKVLQSGFTINAIELSLHKNAVLYAIEKAAFKKAKSINDIPS